MFRQKFSNLKNTSYADRLSLLCLLSIGGWEFSQIIFGYTYYGVKIFSLTHWGLFIPCLVFLLLSLVQKRCRDARYILSLSAVMLLWFLVVNIHRALRQDETSSLNLFLVPYLLALPYAAAAQDKERQAGLKWMAVIYVAAALVLVLYAILLLSNHIPLVLRDYLFWWDNIRLNAIRNPNPTACTFMIGIAFCLGFGLHSQRKWAACLAIGIAVILFVTMSLTNSRTTLLATSLLVGGVLFFAVYQNQRRRLFPALGIAVISMVLLVGASVAIFRFHCTVLAAQAELPQPAVTDTAGAVPNPLEDAAETLPQDTAEALPPDSAETLPPDSVEALPPDTTVPSPETTPARSFLSDLGTLGIRTQIWDATLRAIQGNPSLLLWGTSDPESQIAPVCSVPAIHTHNTWLEMLVRFGIPGLVISIVLTIMAIWSAFVVLFHTDSDIWKKTIAMLVLCLLISGLLEPYLYTAVQDYHFINVFFLLCLGYLIEWARGLRR